MGGRRRSGWEEQEEQEVRRRRRRRWERCSDRLYAAPITDRELARFGWLCPPSHQRSIGEESIGDWAIGAEQGGRPPSWPVLGWA